MKNVWILNHYAQEPNGAGGTRHFDLAEHLTAFGWQASIIAASVDHVSGRQRLKGGEPFKLEYHSGVPFLWVKTPAYNGNGGGRVKNMLAYAFRVLLKKTTRGLPAPDAIIGSSVHPLAAVSGALLARRFVVPFLFEVRDLWPQTLIDMGRIKEGQLITRLLHRLEDWLYRRAARVIVLLPFASKYIAPRGVENDRIVWIPNGVNLKADEFAQAKITKKSSQFVLMYFGAHGEANDLELILDAMKMVQTRTPSKNILLRLIGNGPSKLALVERAKQLELHNVKFEDAVGKSQIPALASQADAFVIAVKDLPNLYRYGISMNKIFDYLAAARPIVISSSAPNDIVSDAQAGITVPAGNAEELADAIISISELPESQRIVMGQSGRKFVEQQHNFEFLAERLAKALNESVEECEK